MDYEKFEHDSYGVARFARVHYGGNGTDLFGSSITHNNVIKLEILDTEVHRQFHKDYTHSKGTIVEVEMSQNQFAELITSMNVGSGIPCTIKYTREKGQIKHKPLRDNVEKIKEELSEDIDETLLTTKKLLRTASRVLTKQTALTKAEKTELLRMVQSIESNLFGANMEFFYKQFNRYVDKKNTESKAEVEAFIQNKLTALGLEKLREQLGTFEAKEVEQIEE